ncbi:MAG: bacteriohemerythrin [Treponema sp.]|jgi:hemerythrin|nr:bacteriohemerythrin [Treponema sp.]
MQFKSDLVTWSSTYSVGIKVIDEQHKGLFNLVNDMYNHVVNDKTAELAYFKEIIQEAVSYVKVHFATEEKIMTSAKFQGYAEHKKAHDSFILAIVDNIRDYEAGKRLTLASFTHFLKDWILTHIAIMDKQYFEYFRKIATRKANGELSIPSAGIA